LAGDTFATSGTVTLAYAGDSVTLEWDVSVTGQVQRDDACYFEDMQVTSGSIFIGTSATVEGETGSFTFGFDFSNVVLDEWGNLASVDLANGVVTLDGQVAVTFSGTLDGLDSDCPGRNVTLVFADGTAMTLCGSSRASRKRWSRCCSSSRCRRRCGNELSRLAEAAACRGLRLFHLAVRAPPTSPRKPGKPVGKRAR
jgi:hypothetical protein